ncbi:LysR family transcriptional regulator [Caballeronia sp. LjRoot34]
MSADARAYVDGVRWLSHQTLRLVPSLSALVEFEAVARLRSFRNAATELGVTWTAVSRQIRLLEELLNVRLLDRIHRNLTLTREGEALYAVVTEAMGKIAGFRPTVDGN